MPHSDELDVTQVLSIQNLNVAFRQDKQSVRAVHQLSFHLNRERRWRLSASLVQVSP